MHRVVPDLEIVAAAALLTAALVVGISSASDYGISIDEFNADDYGPKALAWYTSGFTDRAHFEQVEAPLWYYGPWFQIVVAYLQSFEFADRFPVRHAATFVMGLAGIAAALPMGPARLRQVGGSGRRPPVPDHRLLLWQPLLHSHRCSVYGDNDMGDTLHCPDDARGPAILGRHLCEWSFDRARDGDTHGRDHRAHLSCDCA
jgi:hypothetical protein